MKKSFKNKDLEGILAGIAQLGNYPMPGDLTLAVIDARKKLKAASESYNDACRQIGESRCERDESGQPVSMFLKDEHGKDLLDYPKKLKFKDPVSEAAALEEVKKLGEQLVYIEVKTIDIAAINSLRSITPIQMEALTSLIEIEDKK